MTTINADIQSLSPSALIEFFSVDLTPFGDSVYNFHAGSNGLSTNVVWQGVTYTAYPAQATGFDFSTNGQIPRPKLTLANVGGLLSVLVLAYKDCVGAKVTRKRTLVKFLDAVNFPGGVNASADPTAAISDDYFYIDQKTMETKEAIEFELTAAFDVTGVQLPRRQIIQNLCSWVYRGGECGYTGTSYFTADDAPTSAGNDVCGKRISSCKARFGGGNQLPFGGFPGVGTS